MRLTLSAPHRILATGFFALAALTDGAAGGANLLELCVAAARARGVDAVILWLFEEDEAFAWDVVGVQRQLRHAGIPALVLTRRCWDLSDEPGVDIARFLQELRP